jgi:hypothetical protein
MPFHCCGALIDWVAAIDKSDHIYQTIQQEGVGYLRFLYVICFVTSGKFGDIFFRRQQCLVKCEQGAFLLQYDIDDSLST